MEIGKAVAAIGIAMAGIGAVLISAGVVTAIGFMGPFATGIAAIAAVIVSAGAAYAVYGKQIEEGLKDLRDKGMQIPGIVADCR